MFQIIEGDELAVQLRKFADRVENGEIQITQLSHHVANDCIDVDVSCFDN